MTLRGKTIHGFIWAGASQFGKLSIQFILTMILARLLAPSDYGLLGMATVFVGFFSLFSGLGFESAIIQKAIVTDAELNAVFWLNIFVSIFLCSLLVLCAPYVAIFYDMPQLTTIIRALAITIPIMALSMVQQTLINKEMQFKEIAFRDIFAALVSGFVGIIAALKGLSVWSLVIQTILFQIISGVVFWFFCKWRPSLQFSIKNLKDIYNFGLNLVGFKVINYWARNADNLIIGKLLGPINLGFYSLAYKMMLFPLQNISSVIGQVLFPAFAKIQTNQEKVGRVYLDMLKGISLITYPLMFGIMGAAVELITVFFGEKWLPAVQIVQILALCGVAQSTLSPCGNIILALGRADLQLKYGVVGAVWSIITIIIGARWGIIGISLTYTTGQIIWALIVHKTLMAHLTNTKLIDAFYSIKTSVFIGLSILFSMLIIGSIHISTITMLFLKFSVSCIVYTFLMLALKEYQYIKRQISYRNVEG